jgi:AraC family transcriptional regulator
LDAKAETRRPIRHMHPACLDWRSAAWADGVFDTARRDLTQAVEGTMRLPHHLILVTLRGGAERLEVRSDCGHRYAGPDQPGAVSFVPAQAERRLRFTGVRAAWASIALFPSAFEGLGTLDIASFTNVEDPFLAALLAGFAERLDTDGALEALWCDAMGRAAAAHLARRYGRRSPAPSPAARPMRLAPWQLRRVTEHVEANLAGPIRIAELARVAGVSAGHFHRAFRDTTGQTPLEFVNAARIRQAMAILATEDPGVAALAARVGFASPGHFARVFRARTGVTPSAFRRGG